MSTHDNSGQTLILESSRFGTIEVPEAIRLEFPQGMIGFPEHTEYVLYDILGLSGAEVSDLLASGAAGH